MGMGFAFVIMLLMGDAFDTALSQPPRDLASLVEPATALQVLGVKPEEAALIALTRPKEEKGPDVAKLKKAYEELGAADFQTRRDARETLARAGEAARPYLEKAAKADDPEVRVTARKLLDQLRQEREAGGARPDMEYAKKLYAIRMLAKMKSNKALPVLQAVAKDRDVTLSAAAKDAIDVIKGGKPTRPSGVAMLKKTADLVPPETAFAVALDFERGAKSTTAEQYVKIVTEKGADKLKKQPMWAQMQQQLDQHMGEVHQGLVQAVAMAGNVRVDSVVMLVPKNVGENNGYVAFLFKGLYDPDRMGTLLKQAMRNERQVGKHRVLYDRYGPSFCLLDEETVLFAAGPGRNAEYMDQVFADLSVAKKGRLPKLVEPAFDMVLSGKTKLAGSGAVSEQMRAALKDEGFARELERAKNRAATGGDEEKLELRGLELVQKVTVVPLFTARHVKAADFQLTAHCADEAAAKALETNVDQIKKLLQNLLKAHADEMPAQFKGMFGKPLHEVEFWKLSREGSKLRATFNSDVFGAWSGMMFGMRARAMDRAPMNPAPPPR